MQRRKRIFIDIFGDDEETVESAFDLLEDALGDIEDETGSEIVVRADSANDSD